jgi:hypothetical protein
MKKNGSLLGAGPLTVRVGMREAGEAAREKASAVSLPYTTSLATHFCSSSSFVAFLSVGAFLAADVTRLASSSLMVHAHTAASLALKVSFSHRVASKVLSFLTTVSCSLAFSVVGISSDLAATLASSTTLKHAAQAAVLEVKAHIMPHLRCAGGTRQGHHRLSSYLVVYA